MDGVQLDHGGLLRWILREGWMYKVVPEFPGYRIDEHGDIIGPQGVSLKHRKDKNGYHRVDVFREGKRYTRFVHLLVLAAHVGPRPTGAIGRHWDDDKDNNHVSNLLYGTSSDNIHDTVRLGTNPWSKRRTECPQGHKYDESNTRWRQQGKYRWQSCKRCARDRRKRA